MSFILDALRRAEAERERERRPVPGVHSSTWLPPETKPAARWPNRTWTLGAIALAALVAAAWAAWSWVGPQSRQAPSATAPMPRLATRTAAPLEPAPAPAPPRANDPPAPVVTIAPERPAAPASANPASAPASAAAAPVAVQPPAASASTPAATPPPPPPIPWAQLPEPLRGTVQRLAISGGVHSTDRRQSFVLAAGQIVREGETLPGGATVERILPRAVWLRVEGRLVEVGL